MLHLISDLLNGRRKHKHDRLPTTMWVFVGSKPRSERTFLVPVPDHSAETLLAIIKAWILPGTTIVSFCWVPYFRLGDEGFTHHAVNHSIALLMHALCSQQ